MRFSLRWLAVDRVSIIYFCIINLKSNSPTEVSSSTYLLDSYIIFRFTASILDLVRQWKSWNELCAWRFCFPTKNCIFATMFSTVCMPYYVIRFIGYPLESGIMMLFAPASIHPDSFALSDNFSLNRLMDFYSPSKISGRFRIALLKIFIIVVEL